MCDFVIAPIAAALSGATAAGATAGAATAGLTVGSALQTAGLVAAVAGPVVSGIQQRNALRAQADMVAAQREQQLRLNAIEAERTQRQFARQIRHQASQFAARGLDVGSPTAVFLGQTAAEEMAFATQSVRQTGQAQATELSNQQRMLNIQARQSLLSGSVRGASAFLTGAPALWPELLS